MRNPGVDRSAAELLRALTPVLELVARMSKSVDIPASLQLVLDRLLEATGFGAGAINYVRADGTMQIVAVTGPDGAREQLLGVEVPAGALDRELAMAERWGRLRFLPHELGTVEDVDYVWVPDLALPVTPDGWHPNDSLLAPLYGAPDELIGVLSVDMPDSGLRPDGLQRQLLELLAGQAELALQNARQASRLRASEESFRLAFEATAVGTGLVSLDHRDPLRLLRSNRALSRIAEAASRPSVAALSDLLDPTDPDHDATRWNATIQESADGVYRAEKQLYGAGDRPWVQVVATVLPLHATESGLAIVQVEDITERRRVQRDLQHRATVDPLTGLANRARFVEHARAVAAAARTGGAPGALLFCDLDDFKSINDVFGHLAGDAVLRTCARRLTGQVREVDEVFRLGGDEFVVVLDAFPERDIPPLVARIKDHLAHPIEHEGRQLTVGISIGSAVVDGITDTIEGVLAVADAAMYVDKASRKRHRRPA